MVAENLRSAARIVGSVSELCRAAGITRQQFSRYLSGEVLPSLTTLELVSKASGVQLHRLLSKQKLTEGELKTGNIEQLADHVAVIRPKETMLGYFLEFVLIDLEGTRCAICLTHIWREGDIFRYRRKMPVPYFSGKKGAFWTFDGHVYFSNFAMNVIYVNSDLKSDLLFQMASVHDGRTGDLHGLNAGMAPMSFPRPVAMPTFFTRLDAPLEISQVKSRLRIVDLETLEDPMLVTGSKEMLKMIEGTKFRHTVRLK